MIRASGTLSNSVDLEGTHGDGLAITVSNLDAAGDATATVDVYAHSDEGAIFLGSFTTLARNASPATRIAAIAGCPGTKTWHVEVRGNVATFDAMISLTAGDPCGAFGVRALDAVGKPV